MTLTPRISVIMPVRNEGQFLKTAVESLLVAGSAIDSFEIIIVDGMSDDDTRDVVAKLQSRDKRIKLVDNPQRTVPHAMNLGIKMSQAEVIVRVDGHAEVYPDFLERSLELLAAHPECSCVGGNIENIDLDRGSGVISLAMSSRFGVGNSRFRTGGSEGYVDTLAFGAYRKSDLVMIGLFDEDLIRNQDDELNYRLVKAGRLIWYSPTIRSRYFVRSSLGKLFRQYFQYGYWKVYVNRKHSAVTNLRQLVPPLFVASVIVLAVAALFLPVARVLLAAELLLYLVVASIVALSLGRSLGKALGVLMAFMTLHTGYGLGYLAGMRDFMLLKRRPSARSAELSR